ncbi:MAG TPA: lysylphosphatidylglycerol synthase transmembrane domain-containing protein [Gemmatimonadales bacterium]|nr:lysylphosphatidylglycerol synthase transmembrane domain-containing protein [Gemmatimonadales bacterium]
MRRPLRIALFVLGAIVFGYLVLRIGIGQLVADAWRTGFMFVPIVLLYALVYACSALAWQLSMGESSRPPYLRTYAVLIAAGALNFLTPLINAGGEPFRAAAVAPWLGKRRAAGSVILHRMLHSFAYVLVWFTAVVLAFALLPRDTPNVVLIVLGVVGVLLLGIIALFMSAHRSGVLERILNWIGKVPVIRRLAKRLEPHRATLIELDQQITDLYHRQPGRFVQAILLEYLSRCIFMLEIVLIVASLGYRLGYLRAFTIGGLEAIAGNALFMVPFEIGAREGAFYVLFNLFGLDPHLGLYTSIVGRVRDFVWIAAGLLLILVIGPTAAPASEPPPPPPARADAARARVAP